MKPKGPVLTLVGGLVLAGTLFGSSVLANRSANADRARPGAAANAVAAAPASPGQPAPSQAAPSPEPSRSQPAPVTYAGRVDGGAAAIAITVHNGQGLAYLCDGKRLESWLRGPAGDGQLLLTNAQGASLTGTYDATAAAGTVTVGGRRWTFRVTAVAAPAGLYRIADKVANAAAQGGWIVYDGGQTGTLTLNGVPGAAPPLNLETGEVVINGVTVKPARV